MNNPIVYKSNALVEASYRLSVGELRLLIGCIAMIGKEEKITDEVLYTIKALDIADRANISRQDAYRDLKAASERLYDRSVTVPYAHEGGPPTVRKFRWVQAADYVPSEGLVRLRFSKDALPYLRELGERYTFYYLKDISQMTSAHAIRLYELLIQWRKKTVREVEVSWLRYAFQLENEYPRITDLKKWVIEPAIQQVNEHSPLWVEYEQRKKGRSVTHFVFSYGFKKPAKPKAVPKQGPAPKKPSGGLPEALVRKYMAEGDTYEHGEAKARAHLDAIRGS